MTLKRKNSVQLTIAEIADRLDAEFEGDGSAAISGVAGIRYAREGDISFVANPRYASDVAQTRASAVVVNSQWDRPCSAALIRVESPDRAFARIAEWFAPPPVEYPPGIHPSAVVADDVELGHDVHVGPLAVIESGAVIGNQSVIMAQSYIGHHVHIGSSARIYQQVSIREYACIGDRVIIHNGTVVGSDGFGYTVDKSGVRTKIPQIGTVVVGNDVEIGANVSIDRARFGKTRIGNGVKIDNLVQIAHNVVIGDHAVIVAQVGIAGSTSIGTRAILAGQSGVSGHLVIGEGAIIGAQAGVTKSVPPKTYVSDYPAMPHEKATRLHAYYKQLPDIKKTIGELQERIRRLEAD
jgi:UDP-3-O-[3-hydroxymyristoyl] glucosamine N-acyltransferase